MTIISYTTLEEKIMAYDGIEIDEEKLRKLKARIFALERENYKTKKMKDNEIVERIIKLISQEVDNDN